ncbi:helix-turn-helix domain-containing protein [Methylosinus sp. Ce-a6]|uniref:helix-turn-helix domain-containing protein n=1 Tax=Methylosinus sp. Ce-a6 TaxID=2172005 RepID=UPI00135875E6|nr:helix-turn-helix transcriptional regulator [Methylosinus sp. Ce-a6]
MKKAPDPIDRHVGSRVRMQRILMKMSQEKLGEALGLTFQQVQKYEKGTNRIGASRLQQISKTLNVPPSFFFEGAPTAQPAADGFAEESSSQYVVDFLSTAEGLHLNRAFARIKDAKVRKRVIDLIVTLADQDEAAKEADAGEPVGK